ncbi:MAG: histone deacetylase [bacterium]
MGKKEANTVCIVRDDRYLRHLDHVPHPESPKRLAAVYEALESIERCVPLVYIRPRHASEDELALVHERAYIRRIANIRRFPTLLDPDTPVTEHSFDAAVLAAGGLLDAVDRVVGDQPSPVFALVRPPGHHAERDMARGFCLFNNVAIAAKYARKRHGVRRVLICDWDVHHGNGTQHAFYEDPTVLYFSVHQFPHYPGTGHLLETGTGPGKGFTINIPLPHGQGDREYRAIFREILVPVARTFRPELILVSAGFDPLHCDPLAGMELTEKGFASMTSDLMGLAASFCPGRLILSLEGGYHLPGIVACIDRVIRTLSGQGERCEQADDPPGRIHEAARNVIDRAKAVLAPHWEVM